MEAIGRAGEMQGATGEEPPVERPWYNTGNNRLVALLERNQALHHHVEVVVRKIVEEYTDFYRGLLGTKTLTADGVNGDRHQSERVWAGGAPQVRDHHASRQGGAGAE